MVDTFVDVIKPFFDDHYNEWAAAGYDEEMTSFYIYFERTFIGLKTRISCKVPLIEIAKWNHFNSIMNNYFLLPNNGCDLCARCTFPLPRVISWKAEMCKI